MKARLIKKADVEAVSTNGHSEPMKQPKEAFNPMRGLSYEDRLLKALDGWLEIIDHPEKYDEEEYLNAANEALAIVKEVKRIQRRAMRAERLENHILYGKLMAEEALSVRPKKECKLPRQSGYGLRVTPKPSDPLRQGRGPSTGHRATIKTAWPDPSKGPAPPKVERDRGKPHVGYIWEKKGYRKNGNGKD